MAQKLQAPKGKVFRSESQVEDRLGQLAQQIHMVDLGYGAFSSVGLVFGYALLVILFDRFFSLSSLARQVIFLGFLSFLAWWVYRKLWVPMTRKINPVYAAAMVERLIPDSHNSVINWVELREERIPDSVRKALGNRAERDLHDHEGEEVVSTRGMFIAGALAGVGLCFLIALAALFGKNPFFSHLGRVFTPFVETTIATRNRVTILTPVHGDAVIPMGVPVEIVARVDGRITSEGSPDFPRLMLRYQENEDWHPLFMQPGDVRGEFKIKVLWSDIRSGFSYKVAAGDGESKVHQIEVRLTPLIADFQVLYKFRPYMGKSDLASASRKIEAPEGTTVQIRVRANCKVREGLVRFGDNQDKIYLAVSPTDPTLLQGTFVVTQSGQYRVEYTSAERDNYFDATYHPLTAIKDQPPKVDLTVPGKEVTLAVNGVLNLGGLAVDDFGVRKLTLMMKAGENLPLAAIPYRNEKSLQLPSGGNPASVQYSDFINASSLKEENGAPYKPVVGSFIDYWLEAEDGCDFPKANLGKSKLFRLNFAEKQSEDQTKKDKDKAQKEKEANDKQQDENNRKEEKQRQEEKKENDAKNNQEKKQGDQKSEKKDGKDNPEKSQGGKGGDGKGKDQSKPREEGGQKNADQGNNPEESKEKGKDPQMNDNEFTEQEKKLNEAINKQDRGTGNNAKEKQGTEKNEAKGPKDKNNPGKDKENKDDPGNKKDKGQPKDAEGKDTGKQGMEKSSGGKDQEKKGDPESDKEKASSKEAKGPDGKDAGKEGKDKEGKDKEGKDKGAKGGNTSKGKSGQEEKQGDPKGKENPKGQQDKDDGKGDPNGGQPKGKEAKGGDEKGAQDKAGMNKPGEKKGMEKDEPGNSKGNEKGKQEKTAQEKDGKEGKKEGDKGEEKKGMEKNADGAGKEKNAEGKSGDQKGKDTPGMEKGNTGKGGEEKGGKSKGDSLGGDEKKGSPKNSDKSANDSKNGPEKNAQEKEGKGGKENSKAKEGDSGKGMEKGNGQGDNSKNPGGPDKGKMGEGGMEKGNQKGGPDAKGMDKEGMGKSGMGKGQDKAAGPDGDKGGEKGPGGSEKKGADGKSGQGKDGMGKGDPMGKEDGMEKGNNMGKGGRPSDDNPGQGGKDGRPANDTPGKANPDGKKSPDAASEENKRKAVEAQIENYKKLINPDVLKDAKMSPEDLQRFLQEKKRRVQQELGLKDLDNTPAGLGKGPSLGGQRYQSGAGQAAPDTRAGNQALPPPSYRDAYKEFTKKLAKPEP